MVALNAAKNPLTPRAIVEALNRYIIGQDEAKRAVAVALRNRYRRSLLSDALRQEVTPHNILMAGPTGVGKTEIARRLAKLVQAPFIKVEATKYTEVGYVGRDVESMIRDLVEESVRMVRGVRLEGVQEAAKQQANERLVRLLAPPPQRKRSVNPLESMFQPKEDPEANIPAEVEEKRRQLRIALQGGSLEDKTLEIEVEDNSPSLALEGSGLEQVGELMGNILPKKQKRRRVTVAEARRILSQEEAQKLIDMDEVVQTALDNAQQNGIIFIDEIDKIAGPDRNGGGGGPDVSREGVQRDILPIVEGSTVSTKYGPVKTDHMLFIAAGAFHVSKVEDLVPELQGRFPVRVTLKSLTEADFLAILTKPENALIKQYVALMETEQVRLSFTDEALAAIAHAAYEINEHAEDIGARRLYSVMEALMDEVAFMAGENESEVELRIDKAYVEKQLRPLMKDTDLARFIL